MKFTAISDLHGYLPKDLPGGDVLCICGDIVPLDYQSDFTQSVAWFCLDFAPWADSQPYRKVVFIGGNHDFFLQELGEKNSPTAVMKHLLPGPHKGQSKLVYLCDNSIEIDGIRIYGTPWIADLARWAFYKPEDELAEAICSRDINYALCGHVHTGNHCPEPFGCVRNVVNVSLKDENYKVAFKPFNFEI